MVNSEIILYSTPEGNVKVEVILRDETVWLTQKAMAELFDVDRTVITKHLNNIFKEGELQQDSVCAKIAHTAEDGSQKCREYFSRDSQKTCRTTI